MMYSIPFKLEKDITQLIDEKPVAKDSTEYLPLYHFIIGICCVGIIYSLVFINSASVPKPLMLADEVGYYH